MQSALERPRNKDPPLETNRHRPAGRQLRDLRLAHLAPGAHSQHVYSAHVPLDYASSLRERKRFLLRQHRRTTRCAAICLTRRAAACARRPPPTALPARQSRLPSGPAAKTSNPAKGARAPATTATMMTIPMTMIRRAARAAPRRTARRAAAPMARPAAATICPAICPAIFQTISPAISPKAPARGVRGSAAHRETTWRPISSAGGATPLSSARSCRARARSPPRPRRSQRRRWRRA